MAVVEKNLRMTLEEFDRFVDLPENALKTFEYIQGAAVEVPSNAYVSMIAGIIFGELYIFLKGKGLGFLTGEAGGYQIIGERYAPDVAFMSYARQTAPAREGYNPVPPDLVVEVESDSTNTRDLTIKILNYLAAGTTVWAVYADVKEVYMFVPGEKPRKLTINDMLDGGNVLPGFTLAVKDIFPPEPES